MRFESHQEKQYSPERPESAQLPEGSHSKDYRVRRSLKASSNSAQAFSTPPVSIIALNRIAFGPRPGDIEAFNALGSDDETRLRRYVEKQLNPASIDDSKLESRLNISDYQTLNKSLTELWQEHKLSDDSLQRFRPIWELAYATYMRAAYSERQLVEVLADFWHNHFNVYGYDDPAYSVLVQYDRDVIRPYMLGNFRQMLEANATSTAMLAYLDNFVSSVGKPNENYARELLELHTLGADHYLGSVDSNDVPKDSNGIATDYVEDDIKEVARCLTGWSFAHELETPSTGEFIYRGDKYWHDAEEKRVLGKLIPANQADMKDGRDVLDLLAAHPGTARYICTKLCRRFIADNPPQSLVESAANLFTANWQQPDQLKIVMRHILLSTQFRTTWGEKVKRPFETTVSAMRAIRFDFTLTVNNDNKVWTYSEQLEAQFQSSGQYPYSWGPPNGFPDKSGVWLGNTPLVMGWRTVNYLAEGDIYLRGDDTPNGIYAPVLEDTLEAFPNALDRTPNNLARFWYERILGYEADLQQVTNIAAVLDHSKDSQDSQDPNLPINLDNNDIPTYWQSGLRAMVGMILMSPEFLRR